MADYLDRLPGLHDPVTLRLILPLCLAFVLVGLMRGVIGPRGRAAAAVAIPLSALVVHFVVSGLPSIPPSAAAERIAWLTIAGVALGLTLDLFRMPRAAGWTVAAVWPAAVVGWIGLRTLLAIPGLAARGPEGAFESLILIALFVGFWVGGAIVLGRLRAADGASAAVMLLVAACGLGFVLLRAGLPWLGVPALAIASATGGFMLWNVGRVRFPFGDGGVLGAGTMLLALAAAFGVAADSAVAFVVLMLLVLVFFADRSAARVPLGTGTAGRLAAPLVLAVVAAIPALAAVAVAVLAL